MTISTRTGSSRGGSASLHVAAALLAICTFAACRHQNEDIPRVLGGPLACRGHGSPVPQSAGFYAEVGHAFTFSDIVVRDCSAEPAVLEGVSLLGRAASMRLVGTRVATARQPWISGDRSFPPAFPFSTVPLRGFVVPPLDGSGDEAGVAIVLGLRVTARGVHGFRSVQIDYRVGRLEYRFVVPYAVVGCAPPEAYADDPGTCSAPLPDMPESPVGSGYDAPRGATRPSGQPRPHPGLHVWNAAPGRRVESPVRDGAVG